jgi:hypothetical protein
MADLEESISKLPTSSSYTVGWYYKKGFIFQFCLDISGDSPSLSKATMSIMHQSRSLIVVPKQTPFPIIIQISHPPSTSGFGLAQTRHAVLESSREVRVGKTEIFSKPAPAPLACDSFWRRFITEAPGELKFEVTVE